MGRVDWETRRPAFLAAVESQSQRSVATLTGSWQRVAASRSPMSVMTAETSLGEPADAMMASPRRMAGMVGNREKRRVMELCIIHGNGGWVKD